MSVVNHKHQYLFLHEPHTGGRSIEAALMEDEGSINFNGEHHISMQHLFSRGWITENQFDTYTRFRFIRNPYEVLVTNWPRKRLPFNEWVFGQGRDLLVGGTLFWRYNKQVNIECYYEWLNDRPKEIEDILCKLTGVEVNIPHIGKTKNKPKWQDLLTVSEAIKMEDYYPDIKEYGYRIQDAGHAFA